MGREKGTGKRGCGDRDQTTMDSEKGMGDRGCGGRDGSGENGDTEGGGKGAGRGLSEEGAAKSKWMGGGA